MGLSPGVTEGRGQSDYLTWLVGEAKAIARSLARIHLLLDAPAPHEECWRQELAAIVMHWRISMLDAQLRGAIPARCCEFHRSYMVSVEMLTACGDALTCYIHPPTELDLDVVQQLAVKRLTQAQRAWQELLVRLSALETCESDAVIEPTQAHLLA